MEFSDNLYISQKIKEESFHLALLKRNVPCMGIYLICIDKKSRQLMEIYHSVELIKPFYANKELTVIGLASGRQDFKEMVSQIISDYFKKYNSLENFKSNILDR